MPERYHVIISPKALADLEGAFEWIAKDSVEAASNVINHLLDEIDSLARFPQRYALVVTRRKLPWPLRRMPSRPYRVLYWIDESNAAVRVLAVRHGRQRRWP